MTGSRPGTITVACRAPCPLHVAFCEPTIPLVRPPIVPAAAGSIGLAQRRHHMTRLAILVVAVLFIFGFAGLTVSTISTQGLTLGGVVAVFIIVLMLVGIVGALRNPPQ